MIRNIEKLQAQIESWLRDHLRRANRTKFVVCAPMNEASAATIAMCQGAADTIASDNGSPFELALQAAEMAEKHNGLIVGTLTREEIFTRTYRKYGEGLADIFPLGELYYREVCQLLKYTSLKDLKYRDISADLVEWADRENNFSNIITSEEPPNTSRVWFRYTLPQKEVISKLNQFEKLTRHKRLVQPIFPARTSEFVQ